MKYKCIKCGKTWGEELADSVLSSPNNGNHCSTSELHMDDNKDPYFSHGLCKECFLEKATSIIRRNQLKEGYFDCFRRSDGYCDQFGCKYRNYCLQ